MSVSSVESPVEGRPSAGGTLAQDMEAAAERRASTRNLRALTTLWPILKAHGVETLIACLLMMATSAATLGMSGAVRLLVEHLTSDRSGASVDPWFWLLGAVAVALGLFTALRYYWVTRLGERIVADLRKSVYSHILTLDPAFFSATRTGEVLSRLTTDIQIIENLLATSASIFLRNTLILIGALILMLWVSPKLTLLVLLIIPVVVVPLFLFARPLRNLTTATQDEFARAVGHAGETLDALETVQAFGREGAASERFGAAVERSFGAS